MKAIEPNIGSKSVFSLLPHLKIIAKFNNLRLNRVKEFQTTVNIYKSQLN